MHTKIIFIDFWLQLQVEMKNLLLSNNCHFIRNNKMTENFEDTDEITVLKNNPIIFVQETLSVLYFLKPFLLSRKETSLFVIGKQVNI